MTNKILLWIRANLLRGKYERDMRTEMTTHLERATTRLIERGIPADEARLQAEREFGNVAYLQTEGREARGTLWFDALLADARFALRQYARRRGTTFLMFCILALGLSLSSVLFSGMYGYTTLAPPGVQAKDVVRIRGSLDARNYGLNARMLLEPEFHALETLPQFTEIAGSVDNAVAFLASDAADREPQEATATFVTGNYFKLLGVPMVLGAGLAAASERATVAVISDVIWEEVFGRRSDVIGSTVMVNGVAVTITGVAPPQFNGVHGFHALHIWMPIAAQPQVTPGILPHYAVIARLRDGVTMEAASAAVHAVAQNHTSEEQIATNAKASSQVVPLLSQNLDPDYEREIRVMLLSFSSIATLILLVTCTNVSALLTGLASARRHEVAVRLSLGATRGRVIRQLLTESAVLAVIAASVALAMVAATFRVAMALVPLLPFTLEISWPALSFTFGVAVAVGVLFGLSPALHATRLALAAVLRDSGSGIAANRARLQRGLVTAQIAFTQPLIVLLSAMLIFLLLGLRADLRSDIAQRIVILSVTTPGALQQGTGPELQQRHRERFGEVLRQVRATPGVQAAAPDWWSAIPRSFFVTNPASGGTPVEVDPTGAAPDYFKVMGIPIVAGRGFHASEMMDSSSRQTRIPVVIGADLAALFWGTGDPLGRVIQPTDTAFARRDLIVVGVVDDPLSRNRQGNDEYQIYVPPDTTNPAESMTLLTTTSATPMLPLLRTVARSASFGSIIGIRTLADDDAANDRERQRVAYSLMAAGLVAMLLSAIGLYAVIAFAVSQRTQEIAVRMAVGARGREIAKVFIGDGLRLGAIGLLIGLPVSILALHSLRYQMQLDGVTLMPIVIIAVTGVFVVSFFSSWLPARRAAAVNPAITLRQG